MKIDKRALDALVKDNYLRVQEHPDGGLFIYNYTEKAQYDHFWNEYTMMCRGLILDGENNIVARPFKKFFNLEEDSDGIPNEPFEVYEKMDGSLGIIYTHPKYKMPYLATRGSFQSDQSVVGSEILARKYAKVKFDPEYTYLWEIIYKANRIVVDYGNTEDLFLLAIVHTESGKELPYKDLIEFASKAGMPLVKRHDGIKDLSKIKKLEEDNKEGFVIRFEGGKRLKIKFDEYLRLHRILTGMNARKIWEILKDKQDFSTILDRVPDEFFEWVKTMRQDLLCEFMEREDSAKDIWDKIKSLSTRKEQAIAIMKENKDLSGIVFNMLDNRDYSDLIWKMIKPAHETPFKMEV